MASSSASVQELVKDKGMLISVPQRYIQENQEPTYNNISNYTTNDTNFTPPPAIPLVDMKLLIEGNSTHDVELIHNFHSICKEWGFFQVSFFNLFTFIKLIVSLQWSWYSIIYLFLFSLQITCYDWWLLKYLIRICLYVYIICMSLPPLSLSIYYVYVWMNIHARVFFFKKKIKGGSLP